MAERAFCVHGHFYQPPREDPLTGRVPREAGAAPYQNWNERIHAQCYYPNTLLRNFERISFNFGPTLFEWMFDYDPETQANIIMQAMKNVEAHQVGNAMAQAYNHTILPLASDRDKVTQVRWGIADFEFRFGYKPQGMWLPETGADNETLQALADCGIQYTILAPWQADAEAVDTTHPYRVELLNGQSIVVFFYDQALSTRVSFDPASTVNADRFMGELVMPRFRSEWEGNNKPQLVMIASDGELYGHHQPFRDKFLAYLLDKAAKNHGAQITYPAKWLRDHPVEETISIRPRTSWSCYHGVTRWSGNCSCTPNGEWKEPFRKALNTLADAMDEEYETALKAWVDDPWELRNRYIDVVHGEDTLEGLVYEQGGMRPEGRDLEKLQYFLRSQYERQRMYTSCGWFFDDLDRIEPRNNLAYAAQATWLNRLATGVDLTETIAEELTAVRSWRSGLKAEDVFLKHLQRAGAAWRERVED